jgi:tetratricopeptide (TPR) repeat protein
MKRAGFVGLAALIAAGCATRPPAAQPMDAAYTAYMDAGRTAFRAGRVEKARELYGEAWKRACALDEPGAIANASFNIGICALRLDEPETALRHAREARLESIRAEGDSLDAVRLEASALGRAGRPSEGLALLVQWRADAGRRSEAELAPARVLEASLALEAGDAADAARRLRKAEAGVAALDDPAIDAEAAMARGRIRLREGLHEAAARAFREAAVRSRAARNEAALGRALTLRAEALAMASSPQAAQAWFLAARTLYGQGLIDLSLDALRKALDRADERNDEVLLARARALLEVLERDLRESENVLHARPPAEEPANEGEEP